MLTNTRQFSANLLIRTFTPRLGLGSTIVAALLLRLALVFYVAPHPERFIQEDAAGYNRLALNLIQGHGFSMSESAPYQPDNFRTPGYPLFVGLIYRLMGYMPAMVLVAQSVLSILTCLVTYALGKKLFNERVGLWAAGLLAISPISITYSAMLWSDTLYTLLLTTALWLAVTAWQRQSLRWTAVAGLCLGIATLVHPRSLYYGPLLASLLGLRGLQTRALRVWLRKGALAGLTFLLFFALALSPWYVRNQRVFGTANLTSIAGSNLLFYRAALVEVALHGGDQWEIARRLEAEARQRLPAEPMPTEAELNRVYTELATEKLAEHPFTHALIHLKGTLRVFMPGTFAIQNLLTGAQTSAGDIYKFLIVEVTTQQLWQSFWHSLEPISALFIVADTVLLLIIYLLAIYGTWLQRRSIWIYAILLTIAYFALINGPGSGPRFRLAFTPLLVTLAAVALQRVSLRKQQSQKLLILTNP